MIIIITYKNEEYPIINVEARVLTTLNIYFSKLTPQSEMRSGRNLNSYEILWLFLLTASMKKIGYKITE